MQSERLVLRAIDVVARRPDVIIANGRDAGEDVIPGAYLGTATPSVHPVPS